MLKARGIRHEVLNAKNHAREALIIAEAGSKGAVTIATNMAGRGTDIKLGGNPEFRARHKAGTEATEQQFQTLYQDEIESWRQQYEEVKEAGGLYVLGTERHESRRIDNQLRGRSGRQGDPGKSRFFLCLDDDLMRLFGKGSFNLKSLMSRGLPEGEPLNHSLINKSIERAQNRVEERNFEIRKHLLEYDDVLNEQRKFIYARREEILSDSSLKNRVLATAEDVIEEALASPGEGTRWDPSHLAEFLATLKEKLFFTPTTAEEELASLPPTQLKDRILEEMRSDIAEKEEILGREQLNLAIRYEYLRNIDVRWQDHLENLEALREAVYLRSYAQKNPLLEYKLEGFQIFDELLYTIRIAIARRLLAVKAEGFRARRAQTVSSGATASHGSFGAFQSGRSATSTAQQPQKVQIKRTVPKVGRNDPCPCGSGKKYKYCCGR
jgi:preprotein translocase subunit SecA